MGCGSGIDKLNAYDEDGHFLYSWGTFWYVPGLVWGVHRFVTDSEGSLYTASVRDGHVQKYTPRKGANPDFLVGKPWVVPIKARSKAQQRECELKRGSSFR